MKIENDVMIARYFNTNELNKLSIKEQMSVLGNRLNDIDTEIKILQNEEIAINKYFTRIYLQELQHDKNIITEG